MLPEWVMDALGLVDGDEVQVERAGRVDWRRLRRLAEAREEAHG